MILLSIWLKRHRWRNFGICSKCSQCLNFDTDRALCKAHLAFHATLLQDHYKRAHNDDCLLMEAFINYSWAPNLNKSTVTILSSLILMKTEHYARFTKWLQLCFYFNPLIRYVISYVMYKMLWYIFLFPRLSEKQPHFYHGSWFQIQPTDLASDHVSSKNSTMI